MSRLQGAFSGGKAFIPFIVAGDPSLEITEQLVLKMAEAGADLIELGIPFSDPVAEGPVIQKADSRALSAGTTTDGIFNMVENIRKFSDVPLALMTYANPVFSYGADRFIKKCRNVGVDGIIVPDVPFEEREEFLPYCLKYDIDFVSMIAPTSRSRIKMIAKESQGFLYCVSSMGVTGVRDNIGIEIGDMIKDVRRISHIPCAIGFGISIPEQAAKMGKLADGVIVGSAIVKIIENHGADCIPHVVDFVRAMKRAIKG